MISERSCDTEDWSNDAEDSALYPSNTFSNISQYYSFDWICSNEPVKVVYSSEL